MAPLAAPGRALRSARLALALPVAAATMALGRAAFLVASTALAVGLAWSAQRAVTDDCAGSPTPP